MQQEKYDIFISYRRKGGFETAKHLYDRLLHDGYSVSFDIDTLRNGDFDTELLKRVEECTDFILILNKGAFDRTIDPNFDPQKDWLRQELAHALQLNKNVIPIMLNGFTEFPDNLPADVARVQRRNGPKYDQYYFDALYEKLKDVFLETPKPVKATTRTESASRPTMGTLLVDTDLDCRIFNYGKEVGVAKAGVYTTIELPLGDNDLKYVGLECDKDCYGEVVTVLENHQKLVCVKLLEIHKARKAAERKAVEETKRQAYLLSLADDEFEIIRANNKCICLIRQTGEVVVPVKYDWIGGFNDGLAKVKLNGKYGLIDKTGKEITPVKYGKIYDFREGLAGVELNGKYGFIDKTGKE
ncbi:MAG: WG repeat-containing protein, partial [Alistipes sp.]|nr:WG repeat-containing protein [Alistipes sp.]